MTITEIPIRKHPKIAVMRAATRVEVTLIMVRYDEAYDCFGPFEFAPVDPSCSVSLLPGEDKATLTGSYRCFELTQRDEQDVERITGYCYARDFNSFKKFAQERLGITLIDRTPRPE